MKNVITKFFSKWRWAFLLFGSSTILLIVYLIYSDELINKESNFNLFIGLGIIILFSASLLLLIISSIRIIIRRKWITIISIILIISIGVFSITILLMDNVIANFQPDRFADNLQIPNNIELNIPKDDYINYGNRESDTITTKIFPDFELYQTELPGIYKFIIWTEQIENGTVFLKAFEVTGEKSLSTIEIRENSALQISNPTNEIKEFGPSTFMINEGDWGKFYAARFEVWFSPDNTKKGERKLMEKIYKIEGYSN